MSGILQKKSEFDSGKTNLNVPPLLQYGHFSDSSPG